jgi:beta-glucosidase
MNDDIKNLIGRLSLEEKASLCCGDGFWNTSALPQYDIPALTMTTSFLRYTLLFFYFLRKKI